MGTYSSCPRSGQTCVLGWFKTGTTCEDDYSNTGWNDDSMAWGEVMQALSHFSYHISGGQLVLCDHQGGIYQQKVVLSDPVILSQNQDYGVTDLGPRGISTFFNEHRCNRVCRSNWAMPAHPVGYFRPVAGTSMMRSSVSTARPRSPHSDFYYFGA